MLARDFRPLFIALLFGVSASAHSQTNLPEGAGREIVQSKCAGCHELGRVLRSGYSAQDWRIVVHMMNNVGAQVPDEQLPVLVKYLAENFPEKPRPQGPVIAGPTQVVFKEWVLPTPGSRPHEPLATLDGSIWYTGQMANVLGRVDPTSGHIAEYHLDTPMSGPHGLVADRDGAIWFTANFAGYIGKLDVAAGKITEYKLPSLVARDPHTPLFDRNGILWFTVQSANMIGKLDPRTGQIKLVASPTPHSNPYGMVITSKGVPFFLRVWRQQAREHRPHNHEDLRIRLAAHRKSAAAHRHHVRRCHLVHGLRSRISWPFQSRDGRGEGVGRYAAQNCAAIGPLRRAESTSADETTSLSSSGFAALRLTKPALAPK